MVSPVITQTQIPSSSTPRIKRAVKVQESPSLARVKEQLPGYLEERPEKGMSVLAALVLLGIAILLDLIDLLDLTGVGAVITVVVSLILGAAMFIALYFLDKGDYNFARQVIAWLIEVIPALGILPVNSAAVVLSYFMSKPKVKEKVGQAMQATETGKAVMETVKKAERVSKITRAGK
ncbi:MAG: hypothetical protein AB1721_02290 [Patescibacteria group bacterium]